MADHRPLLLLPAPAAPGPRAKRPPGGPPPTGPSRERQAQRLGPKFQALADALEKRRLAMLARAEGATPEQVVVLETVAPLDQFVNAVHKIAGLEWLGEIEEPDIPPDSDFFNPKNKEKPLSGRVYLTFANQQALTQILSLWRRWTTHQDLGYGFGTFDELFRLLRDVRPWGPKDRLENTGVLDDWRERVKGGQSLVRCEVELWFRRETKLRAAAAVRMRRLLLDLGGRAIQEVTIQEIAYQALLVELPIAEVNRVLATSDTALVQCEDVRLFGAVGQMAAPLTPPEPQPDKSATPVSGGLGDPVAALFDGLPLQNHQRLRGLLDVDDPDGWELNYPVATRVHGTGMASLILHGDLRSEGIPLTRRLYVRPIMQPRSLGWTNPDEAVPEDSLIVDLIHRAVLRVVRGDGNEGPSAPGVRIINLSIGDRSRPFDRVMSPLARLLDYLAYRYGLLFIVSAGNWTGRLELTHAGPLSALDHETLGKLTLQAVAADSRTRRLLSPSEGINVLTVGAAHADAAGPHDTQGWTDPYSDPGMPSIINGQGLGFRRSIKPDVLMEGGRVLMQQEFGTPPPGKIPVRLFSYGRPPGQQVAAPGRIPGDMSSLTHVRGTSGATALTTRRAIQLYDTIDALRGDPNGAIIANAPMATWIRTALVHAAGWRATKVIADALKTRDNANKYREYVSRLVGYGMIDCERLGACTDHRATAFGGGSLSVDQSHIHRFPLPPSLAGKAGWRRLTITLSYLTPVNPMHHVWRRAHLWFEPPNGNLTLERKQADWQAVTRGTLQHEILEGDKADPFVDGNALEIRVSCREVAGALEEAVPYALAVTLEVAEEIGVRIYDEIAQRIRPAVVIAPAKG